MDSAEGGLVNPVRIAFVVTGLGTGGAEHMLVKLLEAGSGTPASVMVVSLLDGGNLEARIKASGAQLVCCRLNRPTGLLGLLQAYRSLRAFRPDVLQGWMYHGNLIASLFGWLLPGRPSVFWSIRQTLYALSDEPWRLRLIIRLLALLSHQVRCVIYNSPLSLHQHRDVGIVPRRDVMIPNGFDLGRYHPDQSCRTQLRNQLGIAEDELLVGIVARVHPMKDHANFIAAAARLATVVPAVRFLLAGAGTDSPAIRAALEAVGIAQRSSCLGRIDDTGRLYPALDLLVLASAWGEGWPNVLGEAMACCVPCVVTDVGESRQIVGDTGCVVPAGDPEALASACAQWLGRPPTELQALGEQARQRVMRNFDIHTIYQRHAEAWRQPVVDVAK